MFIYRLKRHGIVVVFNHHLSSCCCCCSFRHGGGSGGGRGRGAAREGRSKEGCEERYVATRLGRSHKSPTDRSVGVEVQLNRCSTV